MSYLLLALTTYSFLGLRAFIIYLIFYIMINLLFFIILQILINETLNQRIIFISQLKILTTFKNH